MTEPLSERGQRLLEVLVDEGVASGYLPVRVIARRAFDTDSRLGRVKNDLGNLAWRGLVEQSPVDAELFRATDAGAGAL